MREKIKHFSYSAFKTRQRLASLLSSFFHNRMQMTARPDSSLSLYLSTAASQKKKRSPKKNDKMKAMVDKIKHLQRSLHAKNAQLKQSDEQLARVQAEYLRYRVAVETVARKALAGVNDNKTS